MSRKSREQPHYLLLKKRRKRQKSQALLIILNRSSVIQNSWTLVHYVVDTCRVNQNMAAEGHI